MYSRESFAMKRLILGLAVLGSVAALAGESRTWAATQWAVSAGGNGHWYEGILSDLPVGYSNGGTTYMGGITWTAARIAATAKGGWLADITSPEENTFVYNLIEPNQHSGFWFPELTFHCSMGPWLGGVKEAGAWKWYGTDAPFTYTNWYPSEPDNSYRGTGTPEDALQFYDRTWDSHPGSWNDYPSWAVTGGYVVEYANNPDNGTVPEPSTLIVWSLLGGLGIALGWRRWRKSA
jgi:hypothetical protein